MKTEEIKKRLECLRKELRAQCISYGELVELQSLAKYIDPGDVELLEAAGVPEFEEGNDMNSKIKSFHELDVWIADASESKPYTCIKCESGTIIHWEDNTRQQLECNEPECGYEFFLDFDE